jgi:hypothetical protein
MRVVDTSSFPEIEAIDLYRETAFTMIYEVTDSFTDNQRKSARGVELFLVKIMIDNVRYKRAIVPEIPESMVATLTSATGQLAIDTFQPNQDG